MIAYTGEALSYDIPHALSDKLCEQLKELQNLTKLDAEQLLSLYLVMYRFPLNTLLSETSEYIQESFISKLPGIKNAKNYNHERADLSTSMFLTQMQIILANGDVKTSLPSHIQRPSHWNNYFCSCLDFLKMVISHIQEKGAYPE